ncbi:BapA prefix-like domain-containing protein [Ruegeria atlantica]|uniref:BapA prefix-like domain-containing protein n=1 Tax=Ruegeria atlantica TaxID=81569 RepID=UPI00147BE2E3|nr:BapA prefix-like domain-containing protein [Ruegeria atlantica]
MPHQIKDLETGQSLQLSLNEELISLDGPSMVVLDINVDDISATQRQGADLLITLQDGSQIVVENFFLASPEGLDSSVIVDGEVIVDAATAGSDAGGNTGVGLGLAGLGAATAVAVGGSSSSDVGQAEAPAPNDMSVPAVALNADTGTSATDGVTNDATVNVTLTSDAASWEYSVDGGTSWLTGSGSSFELADGDYADGVVQVRQSDEAGNISDPVNLGAVTVDTDSAEIDLGNDADDNDLGQLINPFRYIDTNDNDRVVYFWDRDGDGAATDNDQVDFDAIANLINSEMDADVNLRLLRSGQTNGTRPDDGVQIPSGLNPTGSNADDLFAIWQLVEENGDRNGVPEGWAQGTYWSSSNDSNGERIALDLTTGTWQTESEDDMFFVVLEVT